MAIKRDQHKTIQSNIGKSLRPAQRIGNPSSRAFSFKEEIAPARFLLNNIRYSGIIFNESQSTGSFDASGNTAYTFTSGKTVSGVSGESVSLGTYTDTSKTWAIDEWADYMLSSDGGYFRIKSNTASTVTLYDSSKSPEDGTYSIVPHKPSDLVGSDFVPYPGVPASFKVVDNDENVITLRNELASVYTGVISVGFGFVVTDEDGDFHICPVDNVLNSSGVALTVSTDVIDKNGNPVSVKTGIGSNSFSGMSYQDFANWYIYFVDGDAAGETGTITAYSDGAFTITGLTGTPDAGDSFILRADLNSFSISDAQVDGIYDLFDVDFDNQDWEDLQKTYLISADGNFHLDQAAQNYNSRYSVEYYAENPLTIPVSIISGGSVRMSINGIEQLNNVSSGSLQFSRGYNRLDIYYFTNTSGSLYIDGTNKPIGHYFSMWRDPSPAAPTWVSTSGYDGEVAQESEVNLAWSITGIIGDGGGTEIWYQVSGGADFTFLERIQSPTHSFTHSGLDAQTTYIYKLRHYTAQGDISSFTATRNGVTALDVGSDGDVLTVDVLDSNSYYTTGDTVNIYVMTPNIGLEALPTVTVGGEPAVNESVIEDDPYTYTTWSYVITGSETEGEVTVAASGVTVNGTTVTGSNTIAFDFVAPVILDTDLWLDSDDNIANGSSLYCTVPSRIFIQSGNDLVDTSGTPGYNSGINKLRLLNAFFGTGSSAGASSIKDVNLTSSQFNSVSFNGYILTDSTGSEFTIDSYTDDGGVLKWNLSSGTPANGAYTVSQYSVTDTSSWTEIDFIQYTPVQYNLYDNMPFSEATIPDDTTENNGFRVHISAVDRCSNVSNILSDDMLYNPSATIVPIVYHEFRDTSSIVSANENGWYNDATLKIKIYAESVSTVPLTDIIHRVNGGSWVTTAIDAVSGSVEVTLSEAVGTVEYYASTTAINGVSQQVDYNYDKTIPTWTPSANTPVGNVESIDVSWDSDPEDTLSGPESINIFRHTSDVPESASLVAVIPYSQKIYSDQNVTPYTKYYYWGQAVDIAGNVSTLYDLGGPVQTDAITITRTFRDASAQIFPNENGWLNNSTANMRLTAGTTNGDVNIVEIVYRLNGGSWSTASIGATSGYADVALTEAHGNVEAYAVTATMSSTIFEFEYKYDKTSPTWTPGAISPVGGFERIIVGWTNDAVDALAGLSHVEIYRNTSSSTGTATVIATTSYEYTGYVDTEIDFGTDYYYWAKTVDLAGNKTAFESLGGPVQAEQIVAADVDGALRIENPYDDSDADSWAVRYGIRVPIEAVTIRTGTLGSISQIKKVQYSVNGTDWSEIGGALYNGAMIDPNEIPLESDTVYTIPFTPVQTANYWRATFDNHISGEIDSVNFNSILAADLIVAGTLRLETGLTVWSGSFDASGDMTGGGVAIDQGGLQLWDASGNTTVALYGTAVSGNVAVFGQTSGRQVVITDDGDVQIDSGSLVVGNGNNLVRNSSFAAGETNWDGIENGWAIATEGGLFGPSCAYADRSSTTGYLRTDPIYVDNSKVYVGSMFYKELAAWVDMSVQLSYLQYNSSDSSIGSITMLDSAASGSTSWARLEGATSSLDSSCEYIILLVRFLDTGASQDIDALVDGFQLEEVDHDGQVASPWSPVGVTVIDGGTITTGKIESTDGSTYFDLDDSVLNIDDSTGGTAVAFYGGASGGNVAVFGSTAGKQVLIKDDGDVVVDGGSIIAGKIESANGNTYFDLDDNEIVIEDDAGDPAVTFSGGASGDLAVLGAAGGSQVKVDTDGNVIVDGGTITVGKIESDDGSTYFDLDDNEIGMDDGTGRIEVSSTNGVIGEYSGNKMFDLGIKSGRAFFRGGVMTRRMLAIPLFSDAFGFDRLAGEDSLSGFTTSKGIIYANGSLWATDFDNGDLKEINPNTFTVINTYNLGASVAPAGLAWDGQYIWVACYWNYSVKVIDPSDGTEIHDISLGSAPTTDQRKPVNLAWDGTYMWVTMQNNASVVTKYPVYRIHGTTYTDTAISYSGWDNAVSIVFNGTSVYVTPGDDEYYYSINVGGTTVAKSSALSGFKPGGITFDGHHIWASNNNAIGTNNLIRNLNTGNGYVSKTTPSSDTMSFDGEYLWIRDGAKTYVFHLASLTYYRSYTTSASSTWDGAMAYDGQAVYISADTKIYRYAL